MAVMCCCQYRHVLCIWSASLISHPTAHSRGAAGLVSVLWRLHLELLFVEPCTQHYCYSKINFFCSKFSLCGFFFFMSCIVTFVLRLTWGFLARRLFCFPHVNTHAVTCVYICMHRGVQWFLEAECERSSKWTWFAELGLATCYLIL